jgi:hypothetical protein
MTIGIGVPTGGAGAPAPFAESTSLVDEGLVLADPVAPSSARRALHDQEPTRVANLEKATLGDQPDRAREPPGKRITCLLPVTNLSQTGWVEALV